MPNDSNQQPISDDQELAKVLAGVGQDDATQTTEEPVLPPTIPGAVMPSASSPKPEPSADAPEPVSSLPTPSASPEPSIDLNPPVMPSPASDDRPVVSGELDSIKQEALGELRPLVDKLDVSPEEKFDTYLLLLRSTDDKDLIAPAHDAAKSISDEARRAQALLDIIKEIDFLSQNQK